MATATRVQDGCTIDYTPSADVAAGDVIDLGTYCGIAAVPIKANTLGALQLVGVFDVSKDGNAIGGGVTVYWVVSTSKATATSAGSDAVLGKSLPGGALAGDATVRVYVHPGLS